MEPWTILGWLLVGVVVFIQLGILFIGIRYIYPTVIEVRDYIGEYLKHLKTRNTIPKKGQKWNQEGTILTIDHVNEDGSLVIKIPNASWGGKY